MSVQNPTEFAGVIMLVNSWAACHVTATEKTIISNLEQDLKVAQLIAKTFAEEKNISYDSIPKSLDRPIITVYKAGSTWYPAEIHEENFFY